MLAGGLDRVYPKDHTGLFAQIQEMGAVVSEHRWELDLTQEAFLGVTG